MVMMKGWRTFTRWFGLRESLTRRETGPGELKDRQRRWDERPGSRSEALYYDKV
jgi:hypothetical protein